MGWSRSDPLESQAEYLVGVVAIAGGTYCFEKIVRALWFGSDRFVLVNS